MTTRAEEIAGDGPYKIESYTRGVRKLTYFRVVGPSETGVHSVLTRYIADRQAKLLNAAYKQGQQDRWIPASGGARPNIGDEILILRQRIADTHIAYIIRYLTTEDIDERTTHWMPLPPNPEQR